MIFSMHRSIRNSIIFFLSLCAMGSLFFIGSNIYILSKFESEIMHSTTELQDGPYTALLFGGGMESPTEMSAMQQERVDQLAKLYHEGFIHNIYVTGDDGANRFDEVTAMRARLIELGVPEDIITVDAHGYRTYESCWRADRVFHLEQVLAISQHFHLSRIQYLCESFGIETGAFAVDQREYSEWWTPRLREALARAKAVLQVTVTRPDARVPN